MHVFAFFSIVESAAARLELCGDWHVNFSSSSTSLSCVLRGEVRSEDVEVAAHWWVYRQPSRHRLKDAEKIKRHFILTAARWLRFMGRLQAPPSAWHQSFIDEFDSYMEHDKGLSPMTIRGECGHVQCFLLVIAKVAID